MALPTTIRAFQWSDLAALTRLSNSVNEATGTDGEYDVELMGQYLSQPTSRPEENCFLAESGDALVGFVMIAPELEIGRCVASGGVEKAYRRRGIGRGLLRTAVERASDIGGEVLHVQVAEESEQARRLLLSCGFTAARSYSTMRWDGMIQSAPELPDGFALRSFGGAGDLEGLTDLQNAVFGGSWGFSPNSVEDIEARLRLKTCDAAGVIFATDGDRLAGYNWTLRTAVPGGSTGWICMTGVHPDYRERGVGRAIVLAGMLYLTRKGVKTVELDVDDHNVAAVEMYDSLGFRRVRRLVWFERELRTSAGGHAGPRMRVVGSPQSSRPSSS